MATKSELLKAVKQYEVDLRQAAGDAPQLNRRVVAKLRRTYKGGVLDFSVALEEVGGNPKFITFKFAAPKPASFIFFSYDTSGKRYFNKKIFDRMADYLEEGYLIAEFLELLGQPETA